jgi:hypothetical protein
MPGSTLSTFIDELNGGASIGSTLKFQLVNAFKAILEQERPWIVLRKTDTSKTVTTANTWQSAICKHAATRLVGCSSSMRSGMMAVWHSTRFFA